MDLNKYTIKEVWESEIFESFRGHFVNSCKTVAIEKYVWEAAQFVEK